VLRIGIVLLICAVLMSCDSNQREDIRLLHMQHYNLEKLLRNVSALDQLFTLGANSANDRIQVMQKHVEEITQTLQTLPVGDCKLDSDFARFQRNLEALRENWNETLLTINRKDMLDKSSILLVQEFDNRIAHYMKFVRGQTNVVAAFKPKKEMFRLFRLMTELLSIGSDIRLKLQRMRITNQFDQAEAMNTLKKAYSMRNKLQTLYRGNARINLLPVTNPQARAVLNVLMSQFDKMEVSKFDDEIQKSINDPQSLAQFQEIVSQLENKTLLDVDTVSQLIQQQLSTDDPGIICNDTSLIAKIKDKMS